MSAHGHLGPAIPRIGVLLAMLAAMRTRSSRTERLMAGLLNPEQN